MSQSETAMLIVLGIAIGVFVSMLIGRLAWKLALRLGARRARRHLPKDIADLQLDRDKIRADQAVLAHQIETRLDEMKLRLAEQAAEVSRSRNRVETLMRQIEQRDLRIAGLEADLSAQWNDNQRLAGELTARDVAVTGMQANFLSKLEAAGKAANLVPPVSAKEEAQLQQRVKKFTSVSPRNTEILKPVVRPSSPTAPIPVPETLTLTPNADAHPAEVPQAPKSDPQEAQALPPSESEVIVLSAAPPLAEEPPPQAELMLGDQVIALPAVIEEKRPKAKKTGTRKDPKDVKKPAAEAEAAEPGPWEQPIKIAVNTGTAGSGDSVEVPVQMEPRTDGVTNVISLAQRIRALQKEISR